MVFGEENGHAYVTIKTEVTIIIHDPDDVDALDFPDLIASSRALPPALDDWPNRLGGP